MDGGATLRVSVLGAFRVTRGDAAVPVAGARLRGLAVRLALAGGRPVEPDALIDAIWADAPPAGAAHALQSLVSRLRRILGSPGSVAQVVGGYRLTVDADDVDALRFEQLTATGRDRLRAGDPMTAAARLGEAVALWGAEPGAEPAVIAAVAPTAATRLAGLSVEAVVDLAAAETALGRADAAADRLTALLAGRPVHERAAALLMDALAAQGRQGEALGLYERVRGVLADDLGADPGAALRERHVGLLRAPAATEKPPLSNLPAPLTSFIGRDDDLARVEALLTAGRLVTVLGPGGSGKTRLAVEAARRHRDEYRDGAWLIDLSSIAEPAKIGTAVLAAIGLRGAAVRRGAGDDLDLLVEQLSGRECLLLVDNCEHLIDAVAHLAAALLPRCPDLRVLATSREPLAIGGEALVPLGPLALPGPDDDLDQVRRAASVRLFTERAAAVRPGFAVDRSALPDVLRVVRGLDGLPLALELAAARLRTMSLPELATGLSDRFRLLSTGSRTALPRHRTLRAVIVWSWDLLTDDERTVAERVSVLPGGVTTATATAVCAGTTVPVAAMPELLSGLVDRSLLQLTPEPGRYRMLETLREYGIERLTGTGRIGAVRDLAADHLATLMHEQDRRLRGPGQLTALQLIRAEYDNTLAGLRRRCDSGDATGAVALALSLTWFWQVFGRNSDAAYWLGEALAVPGGDSTPERTCAEAVHLLNRADSRLPLTVEQLAADRARMRELADELLGHPRLPGPYGVFGPVLLTFLEQDRTASRLFDQLAAGDDRWLSGLARLFRAQIAENRGELDTMRTEVDAALDGFRQAGDRWGLAAALSARARLRQYDDLDGALADLREARSLADEFGALSIGDQVDSDLRWVDLHLRRGDTRQALVLLAAVRERAERAASAELLILVDVCEADARLHLGDRDRAGGLLRDADRRAEHSTADQVRSLLGCARAALCLAEGDLPGTEAALTRAYAAGRDSRDLPILSVVAVHTAALTEAYGEARRSAVLLGAASRLRGTHDHTDLRICGLTARGRAVLGEKGFAAAYRAGWELDREQAVIRADPARCR
jgi:predicted ATPase/DNA-binding SARP family transcriptional activator